MSDSIVKFLTAERVEFSLYQPEDISKMSVVKVCVPVAFNALGLPNVGGLYDPAMGPLSVHSGSCPTCHRGYGQCSGHFGHIELPLPVYNALFLKTIFSVLRLACLQCYTIQVPGQIRKLFITQLQLLEVGRVVEAQELAVQFNMLESSSTDTEAAKTVYFEDAINKYVSELLLDSKTQRKEESKNIEALRADLWSFAKQHFVQSKKCTECKMPIPKITLVNNKLMTTIYSPDETCGDKVFYRGEATFITPTEARNHLRALWAKYPDFIAALAPVLKNTTAEHPTDVFFITVIPVSPPKVRPINFIRDKMNEHPQSQIYVQILEQSIVARQVAHVACGGTMDDVGEESRMFYEGISGQTPTEKLHYAWQGLQTAVDNMINAELNNSGRIQSGNSAGLKQVISKKEGLIRMHMMGKRVNFAARSVITPDPNLGLDEIGIPEAFAKILTYPTPVTSWNVSALRDAVVNGPDVHPGACSVQMENGQVHKVANKNATQRQSLAKRLLTPVDNFSQHDSDVCALLPPKVVRRHLLSGDVLLLNRQPTLHKPSIMAHRARVLRGEKTLRLHYANCKAYNADFDGDEMNAHFPQNEVARSEAYNIVEVAQQYLVPKDGTPLSGLIQDHVVAGVRLTIRGRFFSRAEFCRLLHAALPNLNAKAIMLPPAMLKPRRLWSGKQLLSAILLNCLPAGRSPPSLSDTAKISAAAWITHAPRRWKAGGTPLTGAAMSEAEVILRDGELLCGVLDKKHFGSTPYGLTHCLYELYGGTSSMRFLSALGRLFTAFLQNEGFTLGVRDILVVDSADRKREELLERAQSTGAMAVVSALDLDVSSIGTEDSREMHGLPRAAELHLARIASGNKRVRATVDNAYKQFLDPVTNAISSNCLPTGLLEPFPANNLQLMVQSGAKGSTVNTLQISCLLGQIELEGRRPPLLVSGKALPSFCRFETAPRAGGFVADRFLTGIRPQEFFFHCMAGREGLIDTAVKTSRSGYLQRCLIKHLEGLLVAYDGTVRDSDGSVIQYAYGEDGLDVTRAQFFKEKKIAILANNYKAFTDEKSVKYLREACDMEEITKARKEVRRWQRRQHRHSSTSMEKKGKKRKPTPAPVASRFLPCSSLEAFPERMESLLDSYLTSDSDAVRDALLLRLSAASVNPGEPVGVLAAQSIGEPSTQMTLNTFHFAGRGEMNVTLGIPRLREILMMASRNPKTPSMEVPIQANVGGNVADQFRRKLRRSLLSEVLQDIRVTESLYCERKNRARKYVLHFQLLPSEILMYEHSVSNDQVLKHIEKKFLAELFFSLKKRWRSSSVLLDTENKGSRKRSSKEEAGEDDVDPDMVAMDEDGGGGGDGDEDADAPRAAGAQAANASDSDSDAGEAEDEDATQARYRMRHAGDREYDESEEEDEEERERMETGETNGEGKDADNMEESFSQKSTGKKKKTLSANEDEGKKERMEMNETNGEENDYLKIEESFSVQSPHKKKKNSTENDSALSILRKARIADVLRKYGMVSAYAFDERQEQWSEVTLSVPLNFPRVDMTTLLRSVAEKSVVAETPGVRRAFLDSSSADGSVLLRTDGCNLNALFKYPSTLDLKRLYTNDVYAMSQTYGIEAARAVLVREVRDVFSAYGIAVDPRHLYLVADYMTFVGSYEPLSRRGMEAGSSPLQQMSFESSLGFLESATLRGRCDNLRSPSARLMLGKPTVAGTGCFGLVHVL